jgi:hypothetical protein
LDTPYGEEFINPEAPLAQLVEAQNRGQQSYDHQKRGLLSWVSL